jgi:hypothetical protein
LYQKEKLPTKKYNNDQLATNFFISDKDKCKDLSKTKRVATAYEGKKFKQEGNIREDLQYNKLINKLINR